MSHTRPTKILLLGGTSEASRIARELAARNFDAIFSYAGRTHGPIEQPLPTRVGGFGGIEGLTNFLRENRISHIVDATHPFAVQMSAHAVAAAEDGQVGLLRFERAKWTSRDGDQWRVVPDVAGAVAAVKDMVSRTGAPRVFLSIGRNQAHLFSAIDEAFFLLRLVDEAPPDLFGFHDAACEIARGPFNRADEIELLQKHRIEAIVSKNSGGTAAYAKIEAARHLKLPMVMIDRPALPPAATVSALDALFAALAHDAPRGV